MSSTLALTFIPHHASDVNALQFHNERSVDNNIHKHSNKNIKIERVPDNIQLFPKNKEIAKLPYSQRIKRIMEDHTNNKTMRKNGVWMVECTVQFGDDMMYQPESIWVDVLKDTFEQLKKEFGEVNIVSAVIHLDETNPHLHFDFVPINPESKRIDWNGIGRKKQLFEYRNDMMEMLKEKHPELNFGKADASKRIFSNNKSQKEYEHLMKINNEILSGKEELDQRESKLNERENNIVQQEQSNANMLELMRKQQEELEKEKQKLMKAKLNLDALSIQFDLMKSDVSEQLNEIESYNDFKQALNDFDLPDIQQ